jgi:hypothetical protein
MEEQIQKKFPPESSRGFRPFFDVIDFDVVDAAKS